MTNRSCSFQVDCEYPRMQKWASESEEIRVFPSFKFYLNGRELLHIIGTNEIRMRGLIKQHAVQNQDIATKKVRDLRTVAGKIIFSVLHPEFPGPESGDLDDF